MFLLVILIKQKFQTKSVQKHFYYTDNKTVKSISANPCQLLLLCSI